MSVRDILMAAGGVSTGGGTDDNFENVTLLLNGDGTNGAQNNTFLDSSTNNFTITRNGNTTQGSFSPYGNLWSNYFPPDTTNNTQQNLTASITAIGTGNFTIEAWVFPTAPTTTYDQDIITLGTTGFSLSISSGSSGNRNKWQFRDNVTGNWYYTFGSNPEIVFNTWHHIALVRSSTGNGGFKFYVDGVYYPFTTAGSTTLSTNFTSTNIYIGSRWAQASGVTWGTYGGYISNFRYTNTAVYSTDFTPSTTPLTAISGTRLLTCQSNRFIDNSSNALAITVNGSPSVQRFSPFNPTASYSTATIGGSGYFDGSGDYLNTATSATAFAMGTGDYTIEGWAYKSGTANDVGIFGTQATGIRLYWYNGLLIHDCGMGSAGSGGVTVNETAPANNSWFHWACVRNSGVIRLYVNGVSNSTNSGATGNITSTFATIGRELTNYNTFYWDGYISNVRFTKGAALYTSNFTPSTSPLTTTVSSGTVSLLLGMTNAGIPDSAMMNDLETVGNAQVSTTTSKFGTGSLYFPNGSSSLQISPTSNLNMAFGTGDFTVEFWLYASSFTNDYYIFYNNNRTSSNTAPWFNIQLSDGGLGNKLTYNSSTTGMRTLSTTKSSLTGAWNHIACCRSSGVVKVFVNGVQDSYGDITDTTNYTATLGSSIGGYNWYTYVTNPFYIDDLRITKGYARYSANFTPPTAALPTK